LAGRGKSRIADIKTGQKADFTAFSVTASKHKIAFFVGIYYCLQLAPL
jgi:hypothetical protein